MFRILLLIFSSISTLTFAGGFDSSGRPFDIIFGEENELALSFSYLSPSVDLSVSRNQGDGLGLPSQDVSEITNDYFEPRVALRLIVNDQVNCAAQLERPFRFKTRYPDDKLTYLRDEDQANSQVVAPLESEYSSESLTVACSIRYDIDHESELFDKSFFTLIAGPKLQQIEGTFSSDLTEQDLGSFDNYRAELEGKREWGYMLGLAYEIPALALQASLFFHNEIHHDLSGTATAPSPDLSTTVSESVKSATVTPRALNFRLQSGIVENWLAFLELRWGDWSSVDELYVEAGDLSQELELFKNDTLNYKLGLGTQVSDRLSLGAYFESVIDLNPPSTPKGVDGTNLRNPQCKRYSVAFGGKYLLTSKLSVGLGASYYYISRGRFADSAYTVDLDRSQALAVAGNLNYRF